MAKCVGRGPGARHQPGRRGGNVTMNATAHVPKRPKRKCRAGNPAPGLRGIEVCDGRISRGTEANSVDSRAGNTTAHSCRKARCRSILRKNSRVVGPGCKIHDKVIQIAVDAITAPKW